jgi:hypothetical protein
MKKGEPAMFRRFLKAWIFLILVPTSASAGQITYVDVTSSSSGEQPFTAGVVFKKGELFATPSVNILNAQVVVKRHWNDGSVKHAILSGRMTFAANVPSRVAIFSDAPALGGANLTAADIQAAAPSASVQLGSLGTVRLSDLLSSPVRTWISGPEMAECHYRGTVGSSALAVWFYVRLYKGGKTWVRAVVENGTWTRDVHGDGTATAHRSGYNPSYAPDVKIGGATIYNNAGASLTHYAQTRWMVEGWIGGGPDIALKHDLAYLDATRLVPHYWKHNPSAGTLDALTQTYRPMGNGDLPFEMGSAGYSPHIGLLTNWDALYASSGDPRAFRSMVANSSSFNSYPIVWRHLGTGMAIKPSDYPGDMLDDGTYLVGAGPVDWEMNHAPSEGYLAYLMTGDYWHYETMLFHVTLCYLARIHGEGVERLLQSSETRGIGWTLRNMVQLAAVVPDGDAAGGEYRMLLDNNIKHWKGVLDTITTPGIGYLFEGDINAYGPGKVAPWQHHFVIQSVGMGSDLEPLDDMADYNAVRDYLYRAPVGMLGDAAGFCFSDGASYNIKIGDGTSDDPNRWFPTWSEVYRQTYGGSPASCSDLRGNSGSAPDTAATGFWGNLMPAIAYAVDHGAPGAAASWARLTGASNWSQVEQSGFDDKPIWGIVPRGAVAPPPPTALPVRPRRLRARS